MKNVDKQIGSLTRNSNGEIMETAAVALHPSRILEEEEEEVEKEVKQEPMDDTGAQVETALNNTKDSNVIPLQESCLRSVSRSAPPLKKPLYEQFPHNDLNTTYGDSFSAWSLPERHEAKRVCDRLGAITLRCILCKIPDAVYNSFELLGHHMVTAHAASDSDGKISVPCPRNSAGCVWREAVGSTLSGSVLEQIINHLLREHRMAILDILCNCPSGSPVSDKDFCHTNATDEKIASRFGLTASPDQRVETGNQTKKKFTCFHCQKFFLQKCKYFRHILSHHDGQEALNCCKICSFDVAEYQLHTKLFDYVNRVSQATGEAGGCNEDSMVKSRAMEEVTSSPLDKKTLQLQQGTVIQEIEDTMGMSDDPDDILNESSSSGSSVKKVSLDRKPKNSRSKSNTIHFVRYQCFLCVSSVDVFETSVALFAHVRNAHVQSDGQVSTIECPYCTDRKVVQKGVGSYLLSQVLSHMVKKHRIGIPDCVRPFYCPEPNCSFLSIRRYELNAHAQKHFASNRKVPCGKCGKFMQRRSLVLHARSCSASTADREAFRCTVCGKEVSTKQGLQKHFQNKHENRRDFLCCHCTKAFSGKGELEDHAFRRHGVNISNKLVHRCTRCAFETILSFALKRHVAETHSSTRPHQCPVCNKFFKSPMQLKSHKVAHEERTHRCSMCDYAAARKSNLDAHVKAQHSGVQYRCEKCGYQTGYYANLCKHQRTVCSQQNKHAF